MTGVDVVGHTAEVLILVLVLWTRPSGLFGRAVTRRA